MSTHPIQVPGTHYINGQWQSGSTDSFHWQTTDSVGGDILWDGYAATAREIQAATRAARQAFVREAWSTLTVQERLERLQPFVEWVRNHSDAFAMLISAETGKPLWESKTEVQAVMTKLDLSLRAYQERCPDKIIDVNQTPRARLHYRPHGVVAVFGPYNMPAHLPNGHILPALLAGNSVVFKPSEMTPAVGALYSLGMTAADLPAGVFNMLQGARETGELLAACSELDGIFFTGSSATGQALQRVSLEYPQRILALEMGGNNPLIVHEPGDLHAAATMTILSAYITSGQRCTCARRLIVPHGKDGDDFISELRRQITGIRVGGYNQDPEPFLGPVISQTAARAVLTVQSELVQKGGQVLIESRLQEENTALLSPGLIDVTSISNRSDAEVFGPLLQLIRVPDFEQALREANRTHYGLAAALFCEDKERYKQFERVIRAGCVNWNRWSTGASGALPFGGIGLSGNHRPAGYFSTDYCSYPVASLEQDRMQLTGNLPPGLTFE